MAHPLPEPSTILSAIRSSSRALRESANITISQPAIERLLKSPVFLTSFQRVSAQHGLALPLKFSSPLDELNVISILSLLNFGSGYRIPLHTETGRGAWDNIRLLVFSIFIGGSGEDLLSAKGMQQLNEAKVAELMRINVYIEKPHTEIPGVTVGELGGPLYELVMLISHVLVETGQLLEEAGYPSLGAFVVEALKEGARVTKQTSDVQVVLDRLIRFIPAFQDCHIVNGHSVYLFKKALFLVHAITIRFGSLSPPPFPVPNTSQVPVFADNVLPSLLIHLGVIELSPSFQSIFLDDKSSETLISLLAETVSEPNLSGSPPNEGPVLTTDQACILRAAAVDACEMIVEKARELNEPSWRKNIQLTELDMWLWSIAKDRADYRRLERFVLRDTIFF
ncbi:uncharacterized protein C8R40DRAFT_1105112 [Lentinula edodes]|uniref:uncharacterized protein n=1 Tax=Lentinula edodes TaxID=5353 RepID=UPI001E8ED3EB|nr:uncharacterized protein C8R40DRAFT_1105112 [Lentinula edodes]KAH7875144.1 hypothetical protein C8R40DRAFT_1105112 [Lentinula edodes]KAJ3914396.1 hypothetical protein F5877DRAFT_82826 [Lentinula edodes]